MLSINVVVLVVFCGSRAGAVILAAYAITAAYNDQEVGGLLRRVLSIQVVVLFF